MISKNKVIRIYDGPGVCVEGLFHTLKTFRHLFPSTLSEIITPTQVIDENWEEKTALFVLPGGRDIPYQRVLKGKGNEKIKKFVRKGGGFFGICAGSYYAGKFVDFAKGTEIEVQENRDLSFFPGVVRGPVVCDYVYNSNQGARAVTLYTAEGKLKAFYNGGGYFVKAEKISDVRILATYDREKKYPAVIECLYGEGIAVLSSVHLEYDPLDLDVSDPYLKEIIPLLQEENEKRISYLVKTLLVPLKHA